MKKAASRRSELAALPGAEEKQGFSGLEKPYQTKRYLSCGTSIGHFRPDQVISDAVAA
jgi:hypothetical protein